MTDYQAVARAVRGPMRRWWRKTGSWLIVVIAVLILLDSALTLDLILIYNKRVRNALLYLPWLINPLCALLWIMAGDRVNQLIMGLVQDLPEYIDHNWLIKARWEFALRQGWWCVGLLLISWLGYLISMLYRGWIELDWSLVTANVIGLLLSGLDFIIPILYITALLVIPGVRRYVPYLWLVAFNCDWLVGLASQYINIPTFTTGLPDTPWVKIPVALLGLGLSLLPLYLFSRNRMRAGYLAVILTAVMMILSRSQLGCPALTPHSAGLWHAVDTALAWIHGVVFLEPVCSASCYEEIWWKCLGLEGTVEASFRNAALFLLIMVPVCLGHYWLIRWVITPKHATSPESNTSRI